MIDDDDDEEESSEAPLPLEGDGLGRMCWHEGKSIRHDDEGLVINETKVSGSTSDASKNEPEYPLFDSKDTGQHGKNPWR